MKSIVVPTFDRVHAKRREKMTDTKERSSTVFTRRGLLKVSGAALGGLAIGTTVNTFAAKKTQPTEECNACGCPTGECTYPPGYENTQKYTYYNELTKWKPTDGDPGNGKPEMYIPPKPNMATCCIPNWLSCRRIQGS